MAALAFLDHPVVWKISRVGLDLALGLYRKRYETLRRWAVLADDLSLLDVGCGIGQYASATAGPYLGIDLNPRYVRYAGERHRGGNKTFRCVDAAQLRDEGQRFDVVLLVDFLHHLSDEQAVGLLKVAAVIARGCVISFEPVLAQTNFVGRWLVANDRGHYMRPLEALEKLFEKAELPITESRPLPLGPLGTRAIRCDSRQGAIRAAA